jgi:hypothetical protein
VFKESGFVYCAKSKEIYVRKKGHLMHQGLTGILFCSESGSSRTLAVASAERVFSRNTWCQ